MRFFSNDNYVSNCPLSEIDRGQLRSERHRGKEMPVVSHCRERRDAARPAWRGWDGIMAGQWTETTGLSGKPASPMRNVRPTRSHEWRNAGYRSPMAIPSPRLRNCNHASAAAPPLVRPYRIFRN